MCGVEVHFLDLAHPHPTPTPQKKLASRPVNYPPVTIYKDYADFRLSLHGVTDIGLRDNTDCL